MTSLTDRIVDHYERHAADWDADRRRGIPRDSIPIEKPWLDRFAALLPAGGAVLDLGCGGGIRIAQYLIGRGFRWTGVDSSPSLIALCRTRFPHAEWRVADMRGLALAGVYDGIIAWDSFFHLSHDDQRRMFAIFDRYAAPQAVTLFTSGTDHGEAIGSYRGEPLLPRQPRVGRIP
jgi:SAM-dependent methyltransferase